MYNFIPLYLQLQGTPVNIIVGSNVWVEDPELAWIDGQVSKINGQEAEIENTNGKKVHFLLLNVMCLFLSFSSLDCKSTKSSEITFMFVLWNSPLLLVLGSNEISILVLLRLLPNYRKYIQKIWKLLLAESMT